MGAPGYTTFCENGHIVKSVMHHEINDEEVKECQRCSSKKFYTQFEWGDDDYKQLVSMEPKKYEEILGKELMDFVTEKGDKVKGYLVLKIPVFDISKLKNYYETE
jgi:hypothetical protein